MTFIKICFQNTIKKLSISDDKPDWDELCRYLCETLSFAHIDEVRITYTVSHLPIFLQARYTTNGYSCF